MAPFHGLKLLPALWKSTKALIAKAVHAKTPAVATTATPLKARSAYSFLSAKQHLRQTFSRFTLRGNWLPSSLSQSLLRTPAQAAASNPLFARYFSSHASRPASRLAPQINRLFFYKPFASGLRPNLTYGAFPRAVLGYALAGNVNLGGNARYFSHGVPRTAAVVDDVSAGMRAFYKMNANRRSRLEERVKAQRPTFVATRDYTPVNSSLLPPSSHVAGSYIDFDIVPTFAAFDYFSRLSAPFPTPDAQQLVQPLTLNTENLMTSLSTDFHSAIRELQLIHADIQRLSARGDLPISFVNGGRTLRVSFPGCDREYVEALCYDLGIMRGIVGEDEDFSASNGSDVALQFPFAPSRVSGEFSDEMPVGYNAPELTWDATLSSAQAWTRPEASVGAGFERAEEMFESPWAGSGSEGEMSSAPSSRPMNLSDLSMSEGDLVFLPEAENRA